MPHHRQLGRRGPRVSIIGMGCWAIGGMNWGATDDAESVAALHQALDGGVTLLDTADVYGHGHSEALIARVLRERGKQDVVIATKAGNDFYNATADDDQGYGPIRQNYDQEYLVFAAEQSLRRLGVDALDILQLHSANLEQLERDEPWAALEQLKREGKIKHAGWSVQSFEESRHAAILDLHHELLDVIQVRYNILEREAERVLFPKAQSYGLGVIVRIPLLFGLLTGKFTRASRFGDGDHRRFNLSPDKLDDLMTRWDGLRAAYQRFAPQTATQVSLRFCISHPAVHVCIPGGKTPSQIDEHLAAAVLGPFSPEELAAFPTQDE